MTSAKLTRCVTILGLAVAAMSSSAGAAFYDTAVLLDTPMAYWRLDETTGSTTVEDSSGNNHQGTISPTVTLEQAGATRDNNTSVRFVNGKIVFPTVTGLRENFSVEFWMNLTAHTSNSLRSPGDWGEWIQHSSGAGALYVGIGVTDRFTPTDLPNGTQELNAWQHFVFTFNDYDATDGTGKYYKNGVELASKSMAIGNAWTGFELRDSLRGRVDEVAIYDHALAPDRIQAHFEAASLPEPSTLVLLVFGLAVLGLRRRQKTRVA